VPGRIPQTQKKYDIKDKRKIIKVKNRDKAWIDAKKKYRLSAEVMSMAKRLGLNPKKFGSIANHKQQPWKAPLPDFIRELYEERFGEE